MKTQMFKNYYAPTPIKWRKIGDMILAIGTLLSATIALEIDQYKDLLGAKATGYVLLTILFATAIGKYLTNFAAPSEELPASDNDDQPNEPPAEKDGRTDWITNP